MRIVVQITLVFSVPVVHVVVIIFGEIGVVVSNTGQHAEIIQRLFIQSIGHDFTIVKILVDIRIGAVGIMEGINGPQKSSSYYFQQKKIKQTVFTKFFETKKGMMP
jgi:hypothetical protein